MRGFAWGSLLVSVAVAPDSQDLLLIPPKFARPPCQSLLSRQRQYQTGTPQAQQPVSQEDVIRCGSPQRHSLPLNSRGPPSYAPLGLFSDALFLLPYRAENF